ncbi:type 1 glutamine amidotransferase domain-containing protein [Planococcus sp. N028]|uniref:Type 1 glutamine amidotransferase domain-containing protein n=1 Tax=Planococcus shixiaomingii TaxID=3058393 RepID=A0ABT8N5Q6_9BACL|nr:MULTISPECIES: type 1 glutamine amidotransferase domain-containing protein [unclassified Planococcus (in: firmicutes)]MDN7243223.1 type 1 glutamine amidotransferase domain-containing protein [Planococcus sp. N028]WKA55166.1 type 1 glutamine amidotransferase domain-containing protein [Planococcus sp. N022]
MKKILIAVTNHPSLGVEGKVTGLWLRELTDFYHEVKDEFEVDIVSTAPTRVPIDPRSLLAVLTNKKTRHYYMDDSLMDRLKVPLVPSQVDGKEYAAIYFTGGHGTMWDFPHNEGLQELTRTIFDNGGIVSAVCHGPSGLLNVHLAGERPLLAGHVVTGFTDREEKVMGLYKYIPFSLEQAMKEQGVLFKQSPLPLGECVVVSGKIVTGQNPASAKGVALKVIEQLQIETA